MGNFNNRLKRIEEKIILLSRRVEIDDEDFDKLMSVISDEDLINLTSCRDAALIRMTKEMLLKYKFRIDSYQLSQLEKLQKAFFREESEKLSPEDKKEIQDRTEKRMQILDGILDKWEQQLETLATS